MKILFSSSSAAEVRQARQKLFKAGIPCQVRKNPVAQGVFGVPAVPELWIQDESRILAALRLLGKRRLSDMTVILPRA